MAGSTPCPVLRPAVGNRLTAARWVSSSFIGGFNFGLHVGHSHALQCVDNPAPVEFPSCWERSLLDGPDVTPSGSGA